jgi:pimeloyl-ACP methyl ester carboxylesterase
VSEARKIRLRTGVELNVVIAGSDDAPPVILLHGFPESHRTWRELAPRLELRFRLIMPDLRGFGGSDRPQEVSAYHSSVIIADVLALADVIGVPRFSLVGHDFGGVIAWMAAQQHADRVDRLAIVNAPHPFIFQKSLIESREQRRASQYINMLRPPGAEKAIAADLNGFFDRAIASNVALVPILEADRQQYLAEWSQPGALTAMLNWYRASSVVAPPPMLAVPLPDALLGLAPKIVMPTMVLWGMRDRALLPIQLDGLERIVEDLTIIRLPDVGHFAAWEAPDAIAQALEPFLAGERSATAPDQ